MVRTDGPLLFLNDGGGKFRPRPGAFQFANPPQGSFTGAAIADYDRDGWLDIYFCLYSYYQGADPVSYTHLLGGEPSCGETQDIDFAAGKPGRILWTAGRS